MTRKLNITEKTRSANASGKTINKLKKQVSELQKQNTDLENRLQGLLVRLNADEILINEQEEWQKIFNAIGQPALIIDRDQNILEANNVVLHKLHKTLDEVIGKKCFELFHNSNCSPDYCPFQNVISSKKYESSQMPVEALNGTYMISLTPILNENHEVERVIHIATDISETIEAKQKLQESLNRYKNLMNTIPYGVNELDVNGKYIYINKALEEILGYSSAELSKHTVFDIQDSKMNEKRLRAYFKKLVNERPVPEPFFTKNKRKDGKIIDVYIVWNYLFHSDGSLRGFIAVVSDITEKLKIENELLKAKELAEESDRLKSAFLANMSHEIRTPLNGIVGFSDMLDNENLDPETRKKYVEYIHSGSNQLLAIINDIIDISKIEAGQINLVEHKINLHELMLDIHALFEGMRKLKEKNSLELIYNKNNIFDETYVVLDDIRLKQILSNLLTNALKFTEKGKIEFGFEFINNSKLLFYIKDTGVGIKKENIKLVFDRFRQEDESPTREHGGTGLGLSISKGLVDLMGGDIWVESKKGVGSEFYFTLPLKLSYDTNSKDSVRLNKNINWKNKTILLVEDDKLSRILIDTILKETHVKLLFAENGKEAIEMFKKNTNIDLILMDLKIPVIDGYKTTQKIKEMSNHIPIIAQTASAMTEEEQYAYEAGCNDIITKPLKSSELLNCISKYLI